jgi:hypothetical protein
MSDDSLHKTDSECTEILKYIFNDALSLYQKLAPTGWISSDFIQFLHPTPKQQLEEHKLTTENINRFLRKEKGKEKDNFDISSFKQDELTGIHEFEEFLYVLGLTVYDIFSNNHDVVGFDKKSFDLGSLRGSGHFIADFLNENYNNPTKKYEYMDFYMGTIWIKSRGDLTPFYEYVFLKLKEFQCDWNYFFPRLFLIEPKKIFDSSEVQDYSNYKPELAVLNELGLLEEDQQAKKLQEDFDKAFEDEYEKAKYKPLNKIVKAYKNVYGVLPNGHPQKEFE